MKRALGFPLLLAGLLAAVGSPRNPYSLRDGPLQSAPASAQSLFQSGQKALANRDWTEAARAFERTVALEPRWAAAHAALGAAQMQLGRLTEAAKSFTQAVRLQPNEAAFHAGLALVYVRQGRFTEAVRAYTRVIELNPGDFDAHYNLGLVYMAQKSFRQATTQFERARTLSATPEVLINLADALFYAGDNTRATRQSAEIHRQWSDSPKILFSLGLMLVRHNAYDLAAEAFGEAWRLLPQESDIGLQWARCKLYLGNFAEARDALLKIQGTIRDSDELETLLASAYVGLGDTESALQAFRQAVKLNSKNPDARLGLGELLFHKAEVAAATVELKQAYSLAPDDIRFAVSLAQVLLKSGQNEEVVRLLSERAPQFPDSPELPYLLGMAFVNLNRFLQAAAQYEKVVKLTPEDDRAHFLLGYARSELGDGTGAAAAYREAIRLNPNSPLYYNHFASLLEREGQLAEAAACLEKSIALQPKAPIAYYGLGKILVQMGRYREAIEQLQQAIELGHTPARAYYLLATCYDRLGDRATGSKYRERFAALSAQSHQEEYINLSGDLEALSFGRSRYALPPAAGQHPSSQQRQPDNRASPQSP